MGLLEEGKARRWVEKFEAGVSTWHGYKSTVGLEKSALRVELNYTRRENIVKMKEKLESLGLREGEHFTVTWLGEEKVGHLRLLKEGIIELAYVAKHGPEPQRLEAAESLSYLRRRAEVKRAEVLEKLDELIRMGEERGAARLVGHTFEVELETGDSNVKAEAVIKEVKSWIEENEREPRKSKLHIEIEAEISDRNTAEKTPVTWMMTYFRRSKDNAVMGYTTTHADAPGGRDEYAKKIKTLVKTITDEEPAVNNKGGIDYARRHLEGIKKYTELADLITK